MINPLSIFTCIECGKQYDIREVRYRCECGDLLEVLHDLENKFNSLVGDKFDDSQKNQIKDTIFDCEELTAGEFMQSLNV